MPDQAEISGIYAQQEEIRKELEDQEEQDAGRLEENSLTVLDKKMSRFQDIIKGGNIRGIPIPPSMQGEMLQTMGAYKGRLEDLIRRMKEEKALKEQEHRVITTDKLTSLKGGVEEHTKQAQKEARPENLKERTE